MRYAQSNNTWIDKDTGKLNIGGDEIVDRELVVEAKVKDRRRQGVLRLACPSSW